MSGLHMVYVNARSQVLNIFTVYAFIAVFAGVVLCVLPAKENGILIGT